MTQQHPANGEAVVETNSTLRGQGHLRQVGGPMMSTTQQARRQTPRHGAADIMTNAAEKREVHKVF